MKILQSINGASCPNGCISTITYYAKRIVEKGLRVAYRINRSNNP
jgi:hypothetical protein